MNETSLVECVCVCLSLPVRICLRACVLPKRIKQNAATTQCRTRRPSNPNFCRPPNKTPQSMSSWPTSLQGMCSQSSPNTAPPSYDTQCRHRICALTVAGCGGKLLRHSVSSPNLCSQCGRPRGQTLTTLSVVTEFLLSVWPAAGPNSYDTQCRHRISALSVAGRRGEGLRHSVSSPNFGLRLS